jgi:long-chain fatty acid transport protein
MLKIKKIAALLLAVGVSVPAFATNGYFSHGYGIKAKSMGGVGIALPQDAMAGATNPAGMAQVGDRIDFGADLFMPDRTATWTQSPAGLGSPPLGDNRSGKRQFLIPEFGYNRALTANTTLGVIVYGNGGMNTAYNRAIIPGAAGATNTYSNLEQLFIAPTWATKLNAQHSIGVSLNLVRQTFEARGLQAFAGVSSAAGDLTDRGTDTSTGVGLKLGWTGDVSPSVTLGAMYQSRTQMSKFDKYKGLFAEQGRFDIPSSLGLGIAVKASPATTIAADVVRIDYGSIKSLANSSAVHPQVVGINLGTDNGAGFGWSSQTVLKFGISHQFRPNLVLRAGYNYGTTPLNNQNTFFNILAPATVERHLTLGATWILANKSELSMSYMHAFNNEVNGNGGDGRTGAINATPGWPVNLKMNQNAIGIAYGWKI